MRVIEHELNVKRTNPQSLTYLSEDILLFDIETTGFSPKTSQIYMIGTAFLKGDMLTIKQFLAQSKEDEPFILIAFFNLCKQYSSCITYNGLGFDIPYLEEKAGLLKVDSPLSGIKNIDIYKKLRPYKSILKLMNLKQKSLEQFLGIEREDLFTGGELISHYFAYSQSLDEKEEELLLLHNYEDILGMVYLLPVLAYPRVFEGDFSFGKATRNTSIDYYGNEEERVILQADLSYSVPVPVSYRKYGYYLSLRNRELYLSVPVTGNEIRVPYLDYKNYVYLKQEDMAVRKDMASYVDKESKIKATPENCYGKFTITDTNLTAKNFEPYIKTVLMLLSSSN